MPQHRTVTICGLNEMGSVIAMIDAFCEGIAASPRDDHALHLAIEETVSNVLHHGYEGAAHPVTVSLERIAPDRVRAIVTDRAPAYDPLARPEVDTNLPLEDRPIGGLGVHLVKKLMDATHYEWRDGQNILTMELGLERTDE